MRKNFSLTGPETRRKRSVCSKASKCTIERVPYLIFDKVMGIWKSALLYGDCMEPGCIGKSNTNNLPAPTDLTENPYGKKNLFLEMQLKNRLRWFYAELRCRIRTNGADFWKMSSSSRKRGGADAQNTHWVCADPYSKLILFDFSFEEGSDWPASRRFEKWH